jgi:hypothetical protein
MRHVVGTANQLSFLEPCITHVCIVSADLSVHLGYESFSNWPIRSIALANRTYTYRPILVCVWAMGDFPIGPYA